MGGAGGGGDGTVWKRQPWRQTAIFAAATLSTAGPWYVRNWVLTGNPLYSLELLHFPVNPVHAAILRVYQMSLGMGGWTASDWRTVLLYLAGFATLPMLAGFPAAVRDFRRHGFLLVIALLLVAVWLQSVAYTSGGFGLSTRVLSPALVVLAIAAAGWLEPLLRRRCWHLPLLAAILLFQLWTILNGMMFPAQPLTTPPLPARHAFPNVPKPTEFQLADRLAQVLPAGISRALR